MLKLIILLFCFIPIILIGQTWRSTINLNLTVDDEDRIDLYTDKNGHHILRHQGDQIKYYLYNYSGSQVRTCTIQSSINENARLAKLSGYNDTLYISFKNGSYIYTKRSTDAGQNWSTNINSISMTYGTSNGIDVSVSSNGLHISWSEYNSSQSKYDTYYRRLPHSDQSWTDDKRITDTSGDEGGFPTVTTSSNRIHVGYTQGTASEPQYQSLWLDSKSRDKYSSTWQTPQQVYSDSAMCSYLIADNSKLHLFYYRFIPGWGQYHSDLYYKNSNLGSTSWSTPALIQDWSSPGDPVDIIVSANANLNITFQDGIYDLYHKSWNGGTWSSSYEYGSGFRQRISADYNDVYVCWIAESGNDYTIKIRQKDYAPPAPTISISAPYLGHPTISWTKPCLDTKEYKVYRWDTESQTWSLKTTTSSTSWTDEEITCGVMDAYIQYKIKAVDNNDNYSDYSNTVGTYGLIRKPFLSDNLNDSNHPEQFLVKNYPNPFNNATTIELQIPEAVEITLTIYNINGQKINNLFKGVLPAGVFRMSYVAHDLSSGLYIIKMIASMEMGMKYEVTNRMLLIR